MLQRIRAAGLSVLLVVAGCSSRPDPKRDTRPDAKSDATPALRPIKSAAAPMSPTDGVPEPGDPTPPKATADPQQEWIEKRAPGRPVLCYLFGEGHEEFLPLPVGIVGELREEAEADHPADLMALAKFVKRISDLGLTAEGRVSTIPEGVRIENGGRLVSSAAGRVLSERVRAGGGFTLEAIVTPADTEHSGPARIVGISWDSAARNFTLGQERSGWSLRVRTSKEDRNGHRYEFKTEGLTAARTHAAVTFDGRSIRLYVGGRLVEEKEGVDGDLDAWDVSFPLILGNEYRDARDWAGVIRFVAFYDRALTDAQVAAAAADPPPGDPPARAPGGAARKDGQVF
jgi:hypothetical protein